MKVNKKILTSLSVITVALAAVVAGTSAYFSDTETSVDNTFKAGAIDLKIDSYAHYNGLECVDNKWQSYDEPNEEINLLKNGSFEDPEVTNSAGWQLVVPAFWTVEWVDPSLVPDPYKAAALQEYHEGVNGWTAAEGDQYAELDSDWDGPGGAINNEPALVKISQDIATVAGQTYVVKYAFSARPTTNAGDNTLEVWVDGVQVDTQSKAGVGTTNWLDYEKQFVATGTTTTIMFKGGGTNNSLGVFLDDVRVHPMKCTPSEEFTSPCEGTWNLTNLGPSSSKFFNFQDIKPGDYGENTISIHVDNNDAYACMMFSNLEDDDLGLTEPEVEVGDNSDGLGNGEISDYMYMFAWRDNGNNIWEEGEKPLFSETAEAKLAGTVLDGKVYPLATPQTQPYLGSGTDYIGLAWCAGTMTFEGYNIKCDGKTMGNVAQTDAMSVDVTFYVEQARHNEGFTCDGLLPNDVKPTVVTEGSEQ